MKVRTGLLSAVLILTGAGCIFGQWNNIEKIRKTYTASSQECLEIVLDVDAGEIDIQRGRDSYDIELNLEYTEHEFRKKVEFNKSKNRLLIHLKKKSWKNNDFDDDHLVCRVSLQLPHGVDILFDSRLKAGEIDMSLGGIRFREFGMVNWAGEVNIRFDEPNPVKMDFLDINSKVGTLKLTGLGNARFIRADINGGIGELDVDFCGDLLPGAKAKIDLDIGEAVVYLPENFGVEMRIGGLFSFMSSKDIDRGFRKRGRLYYNESYKKDGDIFRVRITPGLGELSVHLD